MRMQFAWFTSEGVSICSLLFSICAILIYIYLHSFRFSNIGFRVYFDWMEISEALSYF